MLQLQLQGVCLAVCGSVSFVAPVMGFLGVVGVACVRVWVFASSVCFFRGAARLAAFVLVTHASATGQAALGTQCAL